MRYCGKLWQNRLPGQVKVFVDCVPRFIRPANTDWRYARYLIPQLKTFDPRIHTWTQHSQMVSLVANANYVMKYATRKLGFPSSPRYLTTLDKVELDQSGCDVIFTHRGCPINAEGHRTVWQDSILDPEMTAYYSPHVNRSSEAEAKAHLYEKVSIVQVSTESERVRLSRTFPSIANKFFATPFFLPHLRAASQTVIEKHQSESIQILFVGNQAKRKGLDLLLDAFAGLDRPCKSRCRLQVVTNFSDGPIKIPADPKIEVLRGLPSQEVIRLMRGAQIVAVPSRFESYGIVYIEAMSQAATPLMPDWEVQRDISGFGQAGCLFSANKPGSLRTELQRLIEDVGWRTEMARAGLTRFNAEFAPAKVASRFFEMFQLSKR